MLGNVTTLVIYIRFHEHCKNMIALVLTTFSLKFNLLI